MKIHDAVFAQTTDDELVELAQAGDNRAFTELIERHRQSCRRMALSILRDGSDADDELQTAYWKAFEHLGQFARGAKFSTWLTRIVVNQCLMRLRKDRRARFLYLDDVVAAEDGVRVELAAGEATPEEAMGERELGRVLRGEIARIPPLLRDVFVLRDVEELPMEEVAGRLGISIAAAKSRLLRARLELRTRMARHLGRQGLATLTA